MRCARSMFFLQLTGGIIVFLTHALIAFLLYRQDNDEKNIEQNNEKNTKSVM